MRAGFCCIAENPPCPCSSLQSMWVDGDVDDSVDGDHDDLDDNGNDDDEDIDIINAMKMSISNHLEQNEAHNE